jgi:hypothetical protein
MEIFFNEISAKYTVANKNAARLQMEGMINLFIKTKEEGFVMCRVENNFDNTVLCAGYTIYNWLSDPDIKKNKKDFYLSYRKFPYETGVEQDENAFIEANYFLNEPLETTFNGSITEGLAWSYVCDTLSVSFPANIVWQKTSIMLIEDKNGVIKNVSVNHASDKNHIAILQPWISSIKAIVLIPSGIIPTQKSIHLSDDHGKDKLKALADKLVNCQFVISIPQSLPYNPTGRSFIKQVFSNGRIDVTLIDEDAGYSMMVQTTGRNLRETQAIAEILKSIY